jgi:TatD DNase family protein
LVKIAVLEYINIHTHISSGSGKSIVNIFPSGNPVRIAANFFSTGLHPWYIEIQDYQRKMEIIRNWSKDISCLAIGETGLDRFSKADMELQMAILKQHVEIAEEVGKPLIIHCVRAFDELISIKKNSRSKVAWIVHGFNSKNQIAKKLIREGMKLSFGRDLAQVKSNAKRALEVIPDHDFFLETDDSYFSIQEIYSFAARIRNIALEDLMIMVQRNFEQTFTLFHE